jgi:hypothetical protein
MRENGVGVLLCAALLGGLVGSGGAWVSADPFCSEKKNCESGHCCPWDVRCYDTGSCGVLTDRGYSVPTCHSPEGTPEGCYIPDNQDYRLCCRLKACSDDDCENCPGDWSDVEQLYCSGSC